MRRKQQFVERVVRLAAEADAAAEAGILPTVPSVKKHRRRDVSFYHDNNQNVGKDLLTTMKESKKIPL